MIAYCKVLWKDGLLVYIIHLNVALFYFTPWFNFLQIFMYVCQVLKRVVDHPEGCFSFMYLSILLEFSQKYYKILVLH